MQQLNPALIPDAIIDLCKHLQTCGGHAWLAGGCVRDMLLGIHPEDFDIEVYGLHRQALADALRLLGKTEDVGKQFGVTKLWYRGLEVDIALPRTEYKTAAGHRGFEVTPDPGLSPQAASQRRDFTINALMFDPLNRQLLDFHHGADDLAKGLLRHVSPAFAEDPLRVLRAMQFAARFNLTLHPETAERCKRLLSEAATLPVERIWQEWKKWSTAACPSRGLEVLHSSGWIACYPGLQSLIGCPQDPRWHPEGDVWTHTLLVVDAAARLAREKLQDDPERHPEAASHLLFAALCHDLGKPLTTFIDDRGAVRSPGHSEAGTAPTRIFLQQIGAPTKYAGVILPLVREHLVHMHSQPTDRAVRRLAARLAPADIALWEMLAEADASGRTPHPPDRPAKGWLDRAAALQHHRSRPAPLITGDTLIKLGADPGPELGRMLHQCYQAQLDGAFETQAGGIIWCRKTFTF